MMVSMMRMTMMISVQVNLETDNSEDYEDDNDIEDVRYPKMTK